MDREASASPLYRLSRRRSQDLRLFGVGRGGGGDGDMAGCLVPVVPIARNVAIIAQRIIQRPAVEPEHVGLRLAHRVEQLEAGDIGIAAQCSA